jgi:hypothetical protein
MRPFRNSSAANPDAHNPALSYAHQHSHGHSDGYPRADSYRHIASFARDAVNDRYA